MVFHGVHPYMMEAAPGDPPRPSNQEILEDEQVQSDHVEDVLPRCRRIVEIVQASIGKCIFPSGSDLRQVLDVIMMEARGALMYWRQRRGTGEIDG